MSAHGAGRGDALCVTHFVGVAKHETFSISMQGDEVIRAQKPRIRGSPPRRPQTSSMTGPVRGAPHSH
jgi:hypothetical protein